jgi:radical SAM superfamily enzyme YgiQ (UPF0313 family)
MRKYIPLPNQYKRLPVVHTTAIRGCPFRCTFCSNNIVFGRKIRAKSPERVIEEITSVTRLYGAREIAFWDDTFTINKKWATSLCNLIMKEKLDIVWSCYASVNTVDKELLQTMGKAGCWNIFYGFESGIQQLINNIEKEITIDQIRNVNKWTREAGIEVRASFMLGLPGETPALAKKTIEFAVELEPDYAQFSITTPFPGTKLYTQANKYGKLSLNFAQYTGWEPVFVPFGYKDGKELVKMEKLAIRSFYLRPRYVLNRIKKIRSTEDLIRYMKGLRLIQGFLM